MSYSKCLSIFLVSLVFLATLFSFHRHIWIGYAVAQLVEALRYKRVLFPIMSLEFFIAIILPVAQWPGVDSGYNRNEYQEYFLGGKGGRGVGFTTLPPSCAECLETLEPQPSGTLRACPGLLHLCHIWNVALTKAMLFNCCTFTNFEQKNDTACRISYVIKILKILHDNFVLCKRHYLKFVKS